MELPRVLFSVSLSHLVVAICKFALSSHSLLAILAVDLLEGFFICYFLTSQLIMLFLLRGV